MCLNMLYLKITILSMTGALPPDPLQPQIVFWLGPLTVCSLTPNLLRLFPTMNFKILNHMHLLVMEVVKISLHYHWNNDWLE